MNNLLRVDNQWVLFVCLTLNPLTAGAVHMRFLFFYSTLHIRF